MKKGFTLIELIAVIVVLSIILAITVPTIIGIIETSTKNAFESDAKMVLKAVDYKKLLNEDFNPEVINKDNIYELLGLSNANYTNISIYIEDNIPEITIIGKGKWNGLIACGTYKDIKVVKSTKDCNNDITPPVITILGDNPFNMYAGDSYSDPGATAIDDVDGDLTSSIVTTGTVNPSVIGTYTITYKVTDSSNNTATATRTVNVVDNVLPTITFGTNGNSTYAKSRTTKVTVSDNVIVNTSSLKYLWNTSTTKPSEASITNAFTNGATINSPAGATGDYYLWILAKDTSGNTTIQRTSVFKLDNTIPVITVNPATVTITEGSVYTDT